ncbi:MAG TPA: hypothetical protein VGE64_03400 [Xanthomonadaceae bacterium]
MSYTFSLQKNQEMSFDQAIELFGSGFLPMAGMGESKIKVADVAFLEFTLKQTPPHDLQNLAFDETEIWFSTRSNFQLLIIDTKRMNSETDPGRFKISNLIVYGVNKEHVLWAKGDLGRPQPLDLIVDEGESGDMIRDPLETIAIAFKLPGKGKTSFSFYLRVKDNARSDALDCDPQVGNDPP